MTPVVATAPDIQQNGTASRKQKNEAARQLLKQWLEDTSGYDEQAWPEARRVLEANRLSVRRRFSD